MSKNLLQIKDLHVQVEEQEILKGVSLDIEPGKIYALMGPNGSGKSTLSYSVAGHPKYQVTAGQILLDQEDITELPAHERAQRGIFLSFQYPKSIPGVTISNFLRTAYKAVKKEDIRVFDFNKKLQEKMEMLNMPLSFRDRFVNDGFSGGEKKKAEILQALVLDPRVIIMDETDSGLDVDALKTVAEGAKQLVAPDKAVILITHYFRILNYLTPDVVHVLKDGKLVESGGADLAARIEEEGFDQFGEPEKPKTSLNMLEETPAPKNSNPFTVLE